MLYNKEMSITCINSDLQSDLNDIVNTICKDYSEENANVFIDEDLRKYIKNKNYKNMMKWKINSNGNILIIDENSIEKLLKSLKNIMTLKIQRKTLFLDIEQHKIILFKKLYKNNKIIIVSRKNRKKDMMKKQEYALSSIHDKIHTIRKNNPIISSYLQEIVSDSDKIGKFLIEFFHVENNILSNYKYGYDKIDLRKLKRTRDVQILLNHVDILKNHVYIFDSDNFSKSNNTIYRNDDKSLSRAIDVLEEQSCI